MYTKFFFALIILTVSFSKAAIYSEDDRAVIVRALCSGKILEDMTREGREKYQKHSEEIERIKSSENRYTTSSSSEILKAKSLDIVMQSKEEIKKILEELRIDLVSKYRNFTGLIEYNGNQYRIKRCFHEGLASFYEQASELILQKLSDIRNYKEAGKIGETLALINQRKAYYKELMGVFQKDEENFLNTRTVFQFLSTMSGFSRTDDAFYVLKNPNIIFLTTLLESTKQVTEAVQLIKDINKTLQSLVIKSQSHQTSDDSEELKLQYVHQRIVEERLKVQEKMSPAQVLQFLTDQGIFIPQNSVLDMLRVHLDLERSSEPPVVIESQVKSSSAISVMSATIVSGSASSTITSQGASFVAQAATSDPKPTVLATTVSAVPVTSSVSISARASALPVTPVGGGVVFTHVTPISSVGQPGQGTSAAIDSEASKSGKKNRK